MERRHKWQSQGSLSYVLLSLGWGETSARRMYLTKRSGKSAASSEHRRITYGIAHIPPGWTIPFGIPFPPLLQKRTKISEPFVWITSARLPAKKKMENLVAFYGWYNSIPLLFLVPKKKLPFEFDGKFSPRSPYFRMRSSQPLFSFWLSG